MRFISLGDALRITGHPSTVALDRWCRRYELRCPDGPVILRRRGAIDAVSLQAALAHSSTARRDRIVKTLSALQALGLLRGNGRAGKVRRAESSPASGPRGGGGAK